MSWTAFATGVRGLWLADTGSDGLNEDGGTYQLTGWFTAVAPDTQAPPYVVVSLTFEDEEHVGDADSQLRTFDFDVELVVNAELGLTATDEYREKVRTLLHRQAPTVAGFTAHHLFRQGSQVIAEGQRTRYIEEYTGSIAKGA